MILYLIHHPDWTRSRIADVLRGRGHDVRMVCPAAGDELPDPATLGGIVIGGGHIGVDQADRFPHLAAELDFTARALTAGTPLLGLCLGAQMIASAAGAVPIGPRPDGLTELGFYPLAATPANRSAGNSPSRPSTSRPSRLWPSVSPIAGPFEGRDPRPASAPQVGVSATAETEHWATARSLWSMLE